MGTATTNWINTLAGLICLQMMFLLAACQQTDNYAPVTDISQAEPVPASGSYRVKPGDTVYSIAWRYGLDYHDLAAYNHLNSSFRLLAGQQIRLKNQQAHARISTPVVAASSSETARLDSTGIAWVRPAAGAMITPYSVTHKGINIAGQLGEPVYASSGGQVVYAGNGLRGYGNLLIIKHNNQYLSAYAHNSKLEVKTGDYVKTGQLIARMGRSDTNRVMLHFEVRENGRPVNPVFIRGIEG